MVSAVKVGGRRLHELARQGVEVERPARTVTVRRFDTEPVPGRPGVYRAVVECSSGTYVRVLAQDLGRALGGGAHVDRLRRTRIGSFDESEARPLDRLGPDDVLTPAQAMRDLESVSVDAAAAASVAHRPPARPCAARRGGGGSLGARATSGGRCSPSTRPRTRTGSARPSSSAPDERRLPSGRDARSQERRSPSAPTTACTSATGRCSATSTARAKAAGLSTVVVTFDRHPAAVVRPESAPQQLTSLDQKLELLAECGIDRTVVIPFDEARAAESAEDFVTEVLVDQLSARLVVVGEDFHFGHGRRGNVDLLRRLGAELGFEVVGVRLTGDGARRRLLHPDPGTGRGGRGRSGGGVARAAPRGPRHGGPRGRAGRSATRVPDGQRGSARRHRPPRRRRLRRALPTARRRGAPCRDLGRAAADLLRAGHCARPRRGLPAPLRRRPLRRARPGSRSPTACETSSASSRSRR